MKDTESKINETFEQMKEVAIEIIDSLDIGNDIGDDYTCFIDKELYKLYQKLDAKHTKLHENLKKPKKRSNQNLILRSNK